MKRLKQVLLALVWAVVLLAAPLGAQIVTNLGPYTLAPTVTVYGPREIAPTAFHFIIYQMMQSCSGVTRDYEAIRWFIADAIAVSNGANWGGMWGNSKGHPEITILKEYIFDGNIVSHEILHDLFLGQNVPMDVSEKCLLRWDNMVIYEEDPKDDV